MGWNGLDLQSEFSSMLGNERTAFKSKVSEWIREIELEIFQAHAWAFTRFKGKKLLSVSSVTEEQTLFTEKPSSAPTAALAAGGNLTAGSTYYVKVTYMETLSKMETEASEASSALTPDSSNKTINLTDIPVSGESLVDKRRIYLKKDDGDYYLYTTINDNTTTTLSVTADTTSVIEPPDYNYFDRLDGEPFFEDGSQLTEMSIQSIRDYYSGNINNTSGKPYVYGMVGQDRILTYPAANQNEELSFYYFKVPRGIYPDSESIPEIPYWLKTVLKLGVRYKGYEYYDRDDQDQAEAKYRRFLAEMISKKGKANKKAGRIRDVTGNSDGYAV